MGVWISSLNMNNFLTGLFDPWIGNFKSDQSGPESNGNEMVLHTLHISRTGVSPSDAD